MEKKRLVTTIIFIDRTKAQNDDYIGERTMGYNSNASPGMRYNYVME